MKEGQAELKESNQSGGQAPFRRLKNISPIDSIPNLFASNRKGG